MSDDYRTGCLAQQPGLKNSYGYVPSEAAGITFISLFGVSTLIHLGQSAWTRQWWTLLFALGGLNHDTDHRYVRSRQRLPARTSPSRQCHSNHWEDVHGTIHPASQPAK
ncbi:Ribosome biogenesis protein Alb1 [Macrophomina phaseolina MS6]|uniref:Ribosome biogenesis protein Alb1 n=1 Tax=Macrophomina phaseolina (strain MS6) TaxID=1126212 RepID=K2RUJ8_MACPH|nr:Ribosome biogenesis protein Alb1 [Macrophomina phaseolina MS6]